MSGQQILPLKDCCCWTEHKVLPNLDIQMGHGAPPEDIGHFWEVRREVPGMIDIIIREAPRDNSSEKRELHLLVSPPSLSYQFQYHLDYANTWHPELWKLSVTMAKVVQLQQK